MFLTECSKVMVNWLVAEKLDTSKTISSQHPGMIDLVCEEVSSIETVYDQKLMNFPTVEKGLPCP